MQLLDHDEVIAHIEAPPEKVYDIIADVTRMPEMSPEVVRCEWLDGATRAEPGARFKATNRVRITWFNTPVITVADRGREIAWSRTEVGGGTVVWRYRFELEGSGTRVTESYEVTKPVNRLGWFIIERIAGRKDRRSDLRSGMERTLERLQALAEGDRDRTTFVTPR
jgi:hypothetical protein